MNTSDILTAYIAAIRALRILDPVGVILELVCDPVRRYLRYCSEVIVSVAHGSRMIDMFMYNFVHSTALLLYSKAVGISDCFWIKKNGHW